jgi:hypothetical protein
MNDHKPRAPRRCPTCGDVREVRYENIGHCKDEWHVPLLEQSRTHVMSDAEKQAQRESWGRGEMAMGEGVARAALPQLGCVQGGCGYVAINASDLVAHYRDAHEVFAVVVEVGETIAPSHSLPYVETQWTPEEIKSFGEQAVAQPASLSDEEIAETVLSRCAHHYSHPELNLGRSVNTRDEAVRVATEIIAAAIHEATARDARIAELERELRYMMWIGHGHFAALYGDDGEMQCCRCIKYGVDDYKRAPLDAVRNAYKAARLELATQRVADSARSRLDDVARTLRELSEKSQSFLNRVKELEPHIDGVIGLKSIRAGFDTWKHGNWVKERDELAALLSRIAPK